MCAHRWWSTSLAFDLVSPTLDLGFGDNSVYSEIVCTLNHALFSWGADKDVRLWVHIVFVYYNTVGAWVGVWLGS